MKYVDEFRSGKSIAHISEAIRAFVPRGRVFNVMEVCGTHTMSVFRFSLKELLPDGIRLISGPGCPVCVTPDSFLDKAIWLARQKNVIVATFGDMLKIPASRSSLERERSLGAAVKVVYSTVDAVEIAERNPGKEVVFFGVGF